MSLLTELDPPPGTQTINRSPLTGLEPARSIQPNENREEAYYFDNVRFRRFPRSSPSHPGSEFRCGFATQALPGADCTAQDERREGFRSEHGLPPWDSLPLPCLCGQEAASSALEASNSRRKRVDSRRELAENRDPSANSLHPCARNCHRFANSCHRCAKNPRRCARNRDPSAKNRHPSANSRRESHPVSPQISYFASFTLTAASAEATRRGLPKAVEVVSEVPKEMVAQASLPVISGIFCHVTGRDACATNPSEDTAADDRGLPETTNGRTPIGKSLGFPEGRVRGVFGSRARCIRKQTYGVLPFILSLGGGRESLQRLSDGSPTGDLHPISSHPCGVYSIQCSERGFAASLTLSIHFGGCTTTPSTANLTPHLP
jgi:hypothetical protein